MPLDHFIPATYLARFSDKNLGRESELLCLRKESNKEFKSKAENLAAEKGLYDVDDDFILGGRKYVDRNWDIFESKISLVLDKVILNQEISFSNWVEVLLQFCGACFIRRRKYKDEFRKRVESSPFFGGSKELVKYLIDDPIQQGISRLSDYEDFLNLISIFKWEVIHTKNQLILGDEVIIYGLPEDFGAGWDARFDSPFYLIPISKHSLIRLSPRMNGVIAYKSKGRWVKRFNQLSIDTNYNETSAYHSK